MTTQAAATMYLAQHLYEQDGKGYAIYNPMDRPVDELPVIYGFNNGGSPGWIYAQLISADGVPLGGHMCSAEGYMPHDLGILEGTRSDRHETFRAHYPDGYRMDFVSGADVAGHEGLNAAFAAYDAKHPATAADGDAA